MLIKLFQAEILLCVILLFNLILNTRLIRNPEKNFPILYKETFIQNTILFILVLALLINSDISGSVFNLFYCNQKTQTLKIFFILIACITIPFIKQSLVVQKINFIEYDIIFLLSILSGLLLISASDLLAVYILIEMQSLCFYVLASYRKTSAFSTEAGIKYFIFGSLFSCLFLFGLSILYGVSGCLSFHDLSLLSLFYYPDEFHDILNFSIYLITILFLFKLGAVPFHFWAPDVYEGSPLASTIIFSILTKPILINLFLKWIFMIGNLYFSLYKFLALVGLLSIMVGTFLALKQKRFKRLVIYSSIAQVGFLLLSLSLNNYDGMVYTYFFLIVYVLTSILIWGNISVLYTFETKYNIFFRQKTSSLFISNLNNMFDYNYSWAILFIVIFFSVAGIPPFVGFISKIYILLELLYSKLQILSILVLLISSISIFYYIRIIKIIFFESTLNKWFTIQKSQIIFDFHGLSISFFILTLFQTFLLILFFFPVLLINICNLFVLNALHF